MKRFKWVISTTLAFFLSLSVINISGVYAEDSNDGSIASSQELILEEGAESLEAPDEEDAQNPNANKENEELEESSAQKETSHYEIVDWKWLDTEESLTYSQEAKQWELQVPGTSEAHPLTVDALAAVLPTQISAVLTGGEELVLDITWDLSQIPSEGIWNKPFMVSASVSQSGYIFPEEAPLQVSILCEDVQMMEIPSGTIDNAPFQDHIIQNDTLVPDTTVNLFDYWLEERTTDDTIPIADTDSVINKGINQGHALNFWDNGLTCIQGAWNAYTGSEAPTRSIVNSLLGNDGYPILNLNHFDFQPALNAGLTQDKATESLAYLFDPAMPHEGKASFSGAGGLFQLKNGYYTYDSAENYAAYYPDSNRFVLYDRPGAKTQTSNGGFYPFNSATDVFEESGAGLVDKGNGNDHMNHYFGVHMRTRFIQKYGGHVSDDPDSEVVRFEFSGDDDVWVFIDGVLVADLGGIHNQGEFAINFATGNVWVNDGDSGPNGHGYHATLKELFGWASVSGNFNGDTFADGTYHTLDFFYMERGNGASNMSLKFNLSSIPESDVIKVDQTGNPVPGVSFDLYAADKNYTVNEKLGSGTTDADGSFIFSDNEGHALSLNNLYAEGVHYMVLRERASPPGYRISGDMNLEMRNSEGNIVLLSKNHWDTGAYAGAKMKVRASKNTLQTYPIVDGQGIMFAVPMKYVGTGSPDLNRLADWRPIWGNPLSEGWHVAEEGTMESVLQAAKQNPYIFQEDSGGDYTASIENMPGDITTYYFMNGTDKSNVRHAVLYFYVPDVTSLEQVTAEKIQLIDEIQYSFSREFATRLFVSNIKNQLIVQKVDDQGNAVNGAEFTLQKDDGMWMDTVTSSDLNKADHGISLEGGGIFPTDGKVLEYGTYTLTETKAPDGYEINSEQTRVVVDESGVYVDAGDKTDGISVYRGAGSVVKTMLQFTTENRIDTTLHDIKAQMYYANDYTGNSTNWSVSDPLQETHLQYNPGQAAVEFEPPIVEGENYMPVLKADSGFSKLLIQQCQDHETEAIGAYKEDLGEKDITHLFSGSVIVQVENKRLCSLEITKTVKDDEGIEPPDASYEFTLHGEDANGDALTGTYSYTGSGGASNGQITLNASGGAVISLKHGQSILINGLPADALIDISEAAGDYTTSIKVDQGTEQAGNKKEDIDFAEKNTHVIEFINTYSLDPTVIFGFTKTDRDNNPLKGASFGIYARICSDSSHDHDDDILVVDANGDVSDVTNGNLDCWEKIDTSTSPANGQIQFASLEQDLEYRLVEYQAPAGYVLPEGQWKLVYNDQKNTFDVTSTNVESTPAFDDQNRVKNYKPGELPITGNRGIILSLLMGNALMICGIVYLMNLKRRGAF